MNSGIRFDQLEEVHATCLWARSSRREASLVGAFVFHLYFLFFSKRAPSPWTAVSPVKSGGEEIKLKKEANLQVHLGSSLCPT